MDQEIKITLSKKDLTFATISVLLISIGTYTGYRIGASDQVSGTPIDKNRTVLFESTIPAGPTAITDNDLYASGLDREVTATISTVPQQSDASWISKMPDTHNPEPPTANTQSQDLQRYYTIPSSELSDHPNSISSESIPRSESFVASKNGTKYYPIDCKSVSRIKEENKVYYSSSDEAELEGLTRALNC